MRLAILLFVPYFFNTINYNDEERVGHGEQHPDIDHLDVSGARQISRYPDKAKNTQYYMLYTILTYLYIYLGIFTKW